MFIGDKDAGDQYHNLIAHGNVAGDPIYVQSRDASGTSSAVSTSGYSANTWHHACAVFGSGSDRRAFIDGGSKGTDSTSRAPTGLDRAAIGALARSLPTFHMSGHIAEAAIWNVALSDAEVALLARSYCPLFIRPEYLKAYWPLIREPDLDKVGRYNMTVYNSPGVMPHPPIIYPAVPTVPLGSAGISPLLLRAIEKY
jgi:hypothetical protein